MPFFKFNRHGCNTANWVARLKTAAAAKTSALKGFFTGNTNSSYPEVAATPASASSAATLTF
jgi:hypothetical protein